MATTAELEHLLRRQRLEVSKLEAKLEEARSSNLAQSGATFPQNFWQESLPDANRRQSVEVRMLEEELRVVQDGISAAWLRGPVASIEHEISRRRHIAKVQQLEQRLAEARRCLSMPLEHRSYGTGPTITGAGYNSSVSSSRPRSAQRPSSAVSSRVAPVCSEREVISSADVVAERRRYFGDRMFRLWVEDCATRGGVRIHCLDTVSFAKSHVDLRDSDIQAMFDHWCDILSRRKQAFDETFLEDRDELREFLYGLLDALYFELDETGQKISLQIPAAVEPPRPPPSRAFVNIQHPQVNPGSSAYPISKEWIREKLLVPRAVVTGRASRRPVSARQANRPYGAYAKPTVAFRSFTGQNVVEKESSSQPRRIPSRPQSARAGMTHPSACTTSFTSVQPPSTGRPPSRPHSACSTAGKMPRGGAFDHIDALFCAAEASIQDEELEKVLNSAASASKSADLWQQHHANDAQFTEPVDFYSQTEARGISNPLCRLKATDKFAVGDEGCSTGSREASELLRPELPQPIRRQARPMSAKAQKHKRVDADDNTAIDDDQEASVLAGEDDVKGANDIDPAALARAVVLQALEPSAPPGKEGFNNADIGMSHDFEKKFGSEDDNGTWQDAMTSEAAAMPG
eukprot:TRINITY_DN10798_c0_g1_i1.p1 TRINITY_DN10798_c0_g1~~TRINITY_DN10798_c0_g1_i1.p1  ORF type:complete len:631 (-),score=114.77 TRINITY_DN10798_c0_g1_i1:31-1923(-)